MNQSILLLLNAITQVFASRSENHLAEYVSLASTLIESGQDVTRELESLVAEIEGFVATGTEPSALDFERVAARRQALVDQIRASETTTSNDADDIH